MKTEKNKTKAVILLMLSAFFFTCMNTFVRLSGDIPSIQKSFFRNLIATFVALVILIKDRNDIHFNPKNLPWYFVRAGFGTVGILCNFYAVDHLVLSNATMLNKMSPFFVLIFSFIILKEKLKPFQIGVVVLAFIGSLFVIKPVFSNADLIPSLVGLLGGMGAGMAYTAVRKLSMKGEKGPMIVFFFSAFSCLIVLPYVIFKGVHINLNQFLLLCGAGISAAAAQFAITAAYSNAPGREISVFDYSQVLFSAVFGFFIFSDIPDKYSFIGYILIIAAAVAIFIYNNRQADNSKAEK